MNIDQPLIDPFSLGRAIESEKVGKRIADPIGLSLRPNPIKSVFVSRQSIDAGEVAGWAIVPLAEGGRRLGPMLRFPSLNQEARLRVAILQ